MNMPILVSKVHGTTDRSKFQSLPACGGHQCNHPMDPIEYECEYEVIGDDGEEILLDCEDCLCNWFDTAGRVTPLTGVTLTVEEATALYGPSDIWTQQCLGEFHE